MSIDWITVAAQIANFLVLVWLLKRFLYRPILDGIDAREAEITHRMQEAVQAKEAAQAVQADFHERERVLHVAQSEMSETIRKSAEDQRDVLLAQAHQRIERDQATWAANLDDETRKYKTRMHRAGASALLSLTRKALTDLADETLEARMAHHLVQKIKPMAAELHLATGRATAAVITSCGALPPSAQDALTAELQTVFPKIVVQFKADRGQTPGLILRVGGAQLDWTVNAYIDGLEALIDGQIATGSDLNAQSHEH